MDTTRIPTARGTRSPAPRTRRTLGAGRQRSHRDARREGALRSQDESGRRPPGAGTASQPGASAAGRRGSALPTVKKRPRHLLSTCGNSPGRCRSWRETGPRAGRRRHEEPVAAEHLPHRRGGAGRGARRRRAGRRYRRRGHSRISPRRSPRACAAGAAAPAGDRRAPPGRLPGSGPEPVAGRTACSAGGRGCLRALALEDELDDATARLEGEAHPSRWAD
jgi:hypothetical protein